MKCDCPLRGTDHSMCMPLPDPIEDFEKRVAALPLKEIARIKRKYHTATGTITDFDEVAF